MRRLAFILGICLAASSAYAGGPKWKYEDPKLNDEMVNIYHDIRNASSDIDDPLTLQGLTVSTITVLSSATIYGTRTNDSPPAGAIGEVVTEYAQSVATSGGAYFDITSIELTPGDWMITGELYGSTGGSASISFAQVGISNTSGDSGVGLTSGDNTFYDGRATGVNSFLSLVVIPRRISISTTTTYYLKGYFTTGGAQVYGNGRLTAWRIR